MSQLDLFGDDAPTWPAARCGNCVHRNARHDAPLGSCVWVGRRGAQEAPCSQWFSDTQVNAWIGKLFAKVYDETSVPQLTAP